MPYRTFLTQLIIILTVFTLHAQKFEYGIGGGLVYGGPLSNKKDTASEGKAHPGPYASAYFRLNFNKHLVLQSGLSYSRNSVDYKSSYSKDTTIVQNIGGSDIEFPTYYNAFVNGRMVFNYLHIPVYIIYRWKYAGIYAGVQASWLFSNNDTANVRIMIGEGGFYDDYIVTADRRNVYHRFEPGILAGAMVFLPAGFSIEIGISRSLLPVYKKAYQTDARGVTAKLYNTFGRMSLCWDISSLVNKKKVKAGASSE